MPRGHKSKGRSRAKRQNVREKSQSVHDVQSTAEGEATSSIGQGVPLSCPNINTPQESQEDVASVSANSSVLLTGAVGGESSDTSAESSVVIFEGRHSSTSVVVSTIHSARRDPLNRKTSILMEFILEKFKVKEPFTRKDMLKLINKKYKEHFPEIIRRISARLELVFGLELKEDPSSQSYTLVGKLGLSTEGSLSSNSGLPKTGLLMTLLAVIFMNGNCTTEEDMWEFLKVVGLYPGRNHPIFGEPKQFITKDLVEENYLEHRRVPGSDPPTYEFLWGPRAHAETTKMKVLEVLAKINNAFPSSFPRLYEEALIDEANRAARRVTAVPGNIRANLRCMTHSSSHI